MKLFYTQHLQIFWNVLRRTWFSVSHCPLIPVLRLLSPLRNRFSFLPWRLLPSRDYRRQWAYLSWTKKEVWKRTLCSHCSRSLWRTDFQRMNQAGCNSHKWPCPGSLLKWSLSLIFRHFVNLFFLFADFGNAGSVPIFLLILCSLFNMIIYSVFFAELNNC